MKYFRVLVTTREVERLPHCPTMIPWTVIEPHEKQAESNHQQSLERLNERGGLCPVELYYVLNDWRYPMPSSDAVTLEFAIDWLLQKVTGI